MSEKALVNFFGDKEDGEGLGWVAGGRSGCRSLFCYNRFVWLFFSKCQKVILDHSQCVELLPTSCFQKALARSMQ
jgi:hypothetical protein